MNLEQLVTESKEANENYWGCAKRTQEPGFHWLKNGMRGDWLQTYTMLKTMSS